MPDNWKPSRHWLEDYGEEGAPLIVLEVGPCTQQVPDRKKSGLRVSDFPLYRRTLKGKRPRKHLGRILTSVKILDVRGTNNQYRWCIVGQPVPEPEED
jgi:hypothetical protein